MLRIAAMQNLFRKYYNIFLRLLHVTHPITYARRRNTTDKIASVNQALLLMPLIHTLRYLTLPRSGDTHKCVSNSTGVDTTNKQNFIVQLDNHETFTGET
jgi:hypothetical protein